MNSILKKSLSIILCIAMLFSTAAFAFAADTKADSAYTYGARYFLETSDAANAKITLDKVDKVLANADIRETIDLKVTKIEIDLRSINGLCKTIDRFKDLMSNPVIWVTAKTLLGDIGDLNLKVWQAKMQRSTAKDVTILNELIELLATNSSIIAKIVDASIDLGVLKNFVDLKALIGPDGVYGLLKKLIVEKALKAPEGSAEYQALYSQTIDSLLFNNIFALFNKADGALPGFTMNGNSTVDNLLLNLLVSVWNKYLIPAIKGLDVDFSGSDNEALKKIDEILNLNGSEIDIESIKIDSTGTFGGQINDILGNLIKAFYPNAKWVNGSYKNYLASNFENLYKSLAADFGLKSSEPVEIVKYIIKNLDIDGMEDYVGNVDSWKSLEDAAVVVLRNTAKMKNIPVTSASNATYENILGDYLTYAMRKIVNFKYVAGSGTNLWTVINDIVNVYLYDKGFAKTLGLKSKATDSVFTKLDEIIAMTKIFDGLKPVENYKSENFAKGLIDAVFSFDFAKAVNMTAVRFLGDFGEKKAVKVVYDVVYNAAKSFFGKEIIVSSASVDTNRLLDNAVSNANLKKITVVNFLTALNAKKANIVPPVLFLAALIIGIEPPKSVTLTLAPAIYDGKTAVLPKTATLAVDGQKKTLYIGKDFYVETAANNVDIGTYAATVHSFGYINGDFNVNYNIALSDVSGLKATVSGNTANLSWTAVPGAKSYTVVVDGKKVTVNTNSYKATGLTYGKVITYTVTANSANSSSKTASATLSTAPATVTGLKTSSVGSTTVKLTWTKAAGATSYVVYYSTDGKTWKNVTVTSNSATLSKLTANKTYKVKVKAYNKNVKKYSEADSAVISVLTAPAKVTGLKVSKTTSTTAKLTWKKAAGATSYIIAYSTDGKKWKTATSKSNSITLKKLSANKSYQFKVLAVNKNGSKGDYSSVVKTKTHVAAPTSLKAKTTKNSAKLTWKKVSGASGYEVYRYNGKKWVKITTIKKGSTVTYTDSKLTKNKTYKYKVRAYSVVSKKNVYGDYSSVLSAKTKK